MSVPVYVPLCLCLHACVCFFYLLLLFYLYINKLKSPESPDHLIVLCSDLQRAEAHGKYAYWHDSASTPQGIVMDRQDMNTRQ